MKLKDITVDTLNSYDEEQEQIRIKNLTRESMMLLGEQLREAKQHFETVEVKAKIRTLSLHYQHGFTVEEIAQLLGLDKRKIKSWIK